MKSFVRLPKHKPWQRQVGGFAKHCQKREPSHHFENSILDARSCLKVTFLLVQWSKSGSLAAAFCFLKSSSYSPVTYLKFLVVYFLQASDSFVVFYIISMLLYWFAFAFVCQYWQTGLKFIQVITYWMKVISANVFNLTCTMFITWKSFFHLFS